MRRSKKILSGMIACTMLFCLGQSVTASTSHYNDSSLTGASDDWNQWVASWQNTANDYTYVSLTPGKDESQLNFAWYSKASDKATPVVHFGTSPADLKTYEGSAASVDTSLTGDVAYMYNYVTVTGLSENTTYYYTVEKGGTQTEIKTYKTGSFENVKILFVGDPQVGASKGQTQNGDSLVNDSGAANTAARNDSFAWNRTLNIAETQNSSLNFIISAGDQVNKTGKPKEEEYAGFLSASALTSLPVATTIGNHDSLNPDYKYHFNNPNTTQNGLTTAGGDYYYSYGSGLFIVLNTNNYNVAEHENTIKEAVASNPDTQWRIVTIHQDIYGSGLDHSDTDGMILRTQLTPIFDKYGIDVVLQGHDHTYSRSKLLYGDSQSHGTYEFRLKSDGNDYDWDNAYNTKTSAQIPLYPEESDTNGTAARAAFSKDNKCYTIEGTTGNTVTDPVGTLYMTANSATGSKFYELIATKQDYIAERSQNWLPSYSVINMTPSSFSIDTYQITNSGEVQKIDKTFTINKTGAAAVSDIALTRGQAVTRIYNAAGSPEVTSMDSFNDVSDSYAKAVAWAKSMGIVNGYSSTSFAPDKNITRAEFATMLYNYAKVKGVSVSAAGTKFQSYSDKSSVPNWAENAFEFSMNSGLLSGPKVNSGGTVTADETDFALTKLCEF
ncbi:MAG: S-layer homology domain-containing protein [Clostridia bacterium]|jgi:hypothetical protein|nr:S-layer homology domain-containing protein [Clostridia bacterium]